MMRVNVDKVLEKDQKLAELDGRAGQDFKRNKLLESFSWFYSFN